MIKGTLNLWYRFKAVVMVGYMLRVVLRKFYNTGSILCLLSQIKKRKSHIPDLRAVRDSIKVAYKKSL